MSMRTFWETSAEVCTNFSRSLYRLHV